MQINVSRVRRLVRSGSSVGVCIPVMFAKELALHPGDEVRIYRVGECVIVQRLEGGNFSPKVIAVPRPESAQVSVTEANDALNQNSHN